MPTVRMVCFANSRKLGGRCIAGLAWNGSEYMGWIRPVSANGHGELGHQRYYADWTDPELLDIIELDLLSPKPSGCHVEDVLIDGGRRWRRQGRITYEDAAKYLSPGTPPLWVDGKDTTNGAHDSIDASQAAALTSSLRLIMPDKLTMEATSEGWESRRRVRGTFKLGPTTYRLAVTDPKIEREFANESIGFTRIAENPILCISVGEVFESQNACYKLIAGVMEEE